MVLIQGLTIALLHISLVVGDIPVNCTYADIAGEWVFHVGQDGHTNTLNCTNFGNNNG